MCRRFRHNMPY
ncbi:hypothetical protein F383_09709 [Gossypium arboreum]|uniref:Uncharacterized protein n=1 Tax=Gossypium arboreum TaxID=29729 RepID=A0A0B0PKE3_GOSAR|nr:hypothetical protein F383_09709 [Gossypium arboreum]